MEDFTRELKSGSTLFLLYGDSGVGKSRLMEVLAETRLADAGIRWLELRSGGDEFDSMDRSAEIESIFATAQEGDIIIADNFEDALKKTRHQLFLSWSTDGIDKKLNLIIVSNSEGFDEFRQLSQQYQVQVQSFRQMPFSSDEVEAFLGFYLFPDQPAGKLNIPSSVRKQLASAGGLVGKVIEIADREGGQINSSVVAEGGSPGKGARVVTAASVLFLLALGIGWYLYDQDLWQETETMQSAAIETEAAPSTLPQNESQNESATSTDTVAVEAPAASAEPEVESETAISQTDTETVAEAEMQAEVVDASSSAQIQIEQSAESDSNISNEARPVADSDSTAMTETASESSIEQVQVETDETVETAAGESDESFKIAPTEALALSEPGTASDSDAVIVEDADQLASLSDSGTKQDPAMLSPAQRFQLELDESAQWIGNLGDTVGTIQILLLSYDGFKPEVYYEFVDRLASRQVDTEQLRIFKTLTGKSEVYSVVYGKYESRRKALDAIDSLPQVLRDTSPIPRSVGGLWEEIRRLEIEN